MDSCPFQLAAVPTDLGGGGAAAFVDLIGR
jgi:hypothetical protein